VLFLLYIASLYEALKDNHPHLGIVGFADDSNLLAFGKSPEDNARQLEEAWATCLQWANTRGMAFNAAKSELIHFNKGRTQWTKALCLAGPGPSDQTSSTITPVASARFLGVWLDWRLSWKAHGQAVDRKLKTQEFALARIAGKTWGPSITRCREVYTKCIRSLIAYGAPSYHQPTPPRGKPTGLATYLTKAQNRSLRIVAGAYKATPIRHLEAETWVPPLDLYLNKRLADFESRIQEPVSVADGPLKAPGSIVQEACNRLVLRAQRYRARTRARGRRPAAGPVVPTAVERAAIIVEGWRARGGHDGTIGALAVAWKDRWEAVMGARQQRALRLADEDPDLTDQTLKRHTGLTKAQSSLLTQARTGAIGLKDFLFRARVPGITTPHCTCGSGRETVEHLVVWCPDPPKPKTWMATRIYSHRDLQWALQGETRWARRIARKILTWLMDTGLLLEYSLARKLELDAVEGPGPI
jgi:hypothetical protein